MAKKIKFWFGSKKEPTKTEKKRRSTAVRTTIIIFAFIIVFVAVGTGFIFLDRFVKSDMNLEEKIVPVGLSDFPDWGGAELEEKIKTAAKSQNGFKLTEDAAMRVGENLTSLAWLYDIKVYAGRDAINVHAKYRKPVGLIKDHSQQFYIDAELVILDYIPISRLSIPEITGVPGYLLSWRNVGAKWARDDVAAAVEMLVLLDKMDNEVAKDKPLLAEIRSIDMSNFNGRRSSSQPHIVFYAKDGTEIRWGAEKGQWQKFLEATDEEKLTLLYNTYQEMGTAQLRAAQKGSFIDLARPRNLSLPIDKY